MATRSLIGIWNSDATVDYVYCHWDGYPEYVGNILVNHYTAVGKIRMLMELGDLSSLGENIGEQHPFNESAIHWCTAYHRDRGENKIATASKRIHINKFYDNASASGVDYTYLFDGDCWECYDVHAGKVVEDLYQY